MLLRMTNPLPLPIGPLTPRREVVPVDDQRRVFLNGHLVAPYPCDDKGTERVLVTQLAEVLALPDSQIAAAFGFHAVTLSRLRSQGCQGGAAALMPRQTGPQGPQQDDSATGGPRPRLARSRTLLAGHRRERLAPRPNDLPRQGGGPVRRRTDATPPTGPASGNRGAVRAGRPLHPGGGRLGRRALHSLRRCPAPLRRPGTPGLVGRFPASGRGPRALPAVRMAADRGHPRFLLCLALPLPRGLEERPAPGSGRTHRSTSGPLGFEFAHQAQGPGRESRPAGLLARDAPPLPCSGARLGRAVLRGRAFQS